SVIEPYAHETALALVIGSITYFTIVVGELVPKSIALNDPERIALAVAPVIHVFTMATFPLVKALSFSTSVIVKLLRIKETDQDRLSEEELRAIIRTANAQGVLDKQESEAHENLFRFSDHVARTLMTRRGELEWLDSTRPLEELLDQVRGSLRSKFPVCKGDLDEIQGILTARDLFEAADEPGFKLEDVVVPPIIVPENAPAFTILRLFRKRKQYAAVVVDEHGQLEGLITLHDLTEAIVGDLPDEDDPHEHRIVKRADGSLLVDGQVLISDLNQYAGTTLIHELDSGYATVAGHFLQRLERVPIVGDTLRDERFSGEVLDMDGNRIDKVLIRIHPL
ncbi:MAG: HlyC/CorC family transporter, partial [Flavobacteriales bacterium]|nr:HlyC/CorC family transporter [Flavobacteriales bacterium]